MSKAASLPTVFGPQYMKLAALRAAPPLQEASSSKGVALGGGSVGGGGSNQRP